MNILNISGLIATVIGLAFDIAGATIIFRGLKIDSRKAYEAAFDAAPLTFDEGSGLTRADIAGRLAESNAMSNVRWSLRGLKAFIIGFVLQGLGAILGFIGNLQ